MILDDNLVSIDSANMSGISGATISGRAVALNSFLHPGKMDRVPLYVTVAGVACSSGASINIRVQQSPDNTASNFVNAGPSWSIPLTSDVYLSSGVIVSSGTSGASSGYVINPAITGGRNIGPRYLPPQVSEGWVRVMITGGGAAITGGTAFAAVTREDYQPYEEDEKLDSSSL